MYQLLIVDDEDIEREGMAEFIPWNNYEVELVGTAWNGVEGYEQIQQFRPDIVLTDIKMPVMNGIELIRKARKDFPDTEFVVLSGYGEYEFTSQAMEEGVRFYILKPCDEEKILEVLNKVKLEIDAKRSRNKKEKEYQHTVKKLLPRAKEQVFRNMLLGREQMPDDYALFWKEMGEQREEAALLAFRLEKGFDYLEQFVLGNILLELLGKEAVMLSAAIQKDIFYWISQGAMEHLEEAVETARNEFKRFQPMPLKAAVSGIGLLSDVGKHYLEIQELLRMGAYEQQLKLLRHDLSGQLTSNAMLLVDYHRIKEAGSYAELLFEIYLAFVKMELNQYKWQQKLEVCSWILRILYPQEVVELPVVLENQEGDLWIRLADRIADKQGMGQPDEKDEQRFRRILQAVFEQIQNPDLNIQYLSKEVLFMNEDYFGRIFAKRQKEKFSTFLVQQRITLAKRLLQYNPELKVAQLAELSGYSPDGQYFSKAFRKVTGVTPSDFRDEVKRGR